mgnify:FL=1
MLKKSLFIAITCLFIGAFSTQLSAQSETSWETSGFYTYVVCDGEYLGYINGIMDYHLVRHFKNGELAFVIYQAKGEAESSFSDEKFSYKEKGKIRFDKEIEYYVLHLKGDQGSSYMMHITIDWDTWEWIFGPVNCK